jgi:alkylhydroperoxidase family enzyme
MTWLTRTAASIDPDADGSRAALGLRPEFLARYDALTARIWAAGGPDPRLLELCRLRIAQLHDSPYDLAVRHRPAVDAGLTEDAVAALRDYPTSPLFGEHDRRALAFTEQYVMDVHGITDAQFAEVAAGMTDAQMTAFTFALGIFDGLTRFRAVLGVRAPADTLIDPAATGA